MFNNLKNNINELIISSAFIYVSKGFKVLPLIFRNKIPLKGTKGHKTATFDEKIISNWFKDEPLNIGIATGEASSIIVVDVDFRNGGEKSFGELEQAIGKLPKTLKVITGNGFHLYYSIPSGALKSRKLEKYQGIDFKADGGYVVAPPSIHPNGKIYEWEKEHSPNDIEIANIPEKLLIMLKDNNKKREPKNNISKSIINEKSNLHHNSKNEIQSNDFIYNIEKPNLEIETVLNEYSYTKWNTKVILINNKDFTFKISSPFNSDSNPSFFLNDFSFVDNSEEKLGGNAYYLIARYENLDYKIPNDFIKILYKAYSILGLNVDEIWSKYANALLEDNKNGKSKMSLVFAHSEAFKRKLEFENTPIVFMGGDCYMYSKGVYDKINKKKIEKLIKNQLGNLSTVYLIKNIFELLLIDFHKEIFDFDANKNIINVKNGLYHIDKKMLMLHDSRYLSLTQLPVSYDEEADCPEWKSILEHLLKDNELEVFMKELFGYIMLNKKLLHRFVIFFGNGENGKGFFSDVLKEFVGIKNVSAIPLGTLGNDLRILIGLIGKKVNISSELPVDKNFRLKEDSIKMLSSADSLSIDKKYQPEPLTFVNEAFLIFMTNRLPVLRDVGDSMKRRLLVIEFKNKIPSYIKKSGGNYSHTLIQKEGSGILNWALEGIELALENKLNVLPNAVEKMNTTLLIESDLIGSFIDEHCNYKKESTLLPAVLYELYNDFCRLSNLKSLSKQYFIKEVSSKNNISYGKDWSGENRGKKVFKGLSLKTLANNSTQIHGIA